MPPKEEFIERFIIGLERADRLWDEKAATLGPEELSCRTGCFGCCVGLFAIGLPEAFAIRAAVAKLPAPVRAGVMARAGRAVETSAATFPGDAAAGILDPEREESAETAWLEAVRGIPCPALELPAGRCTVYRARPTTCRTYGLALRSGEEIALPACELNLAGALPAHVLASGIDAARLAAVDQALLEIASEASLPAGVETTIAHALTGTAFDVL
jgi:Fe-S-cluster containining protein